MGAQKTPETVTLDKVIETATELLARDYGGPLYRRGVVDMVLHLTDLNDSDRAAVNRFLLKEARFK